MTANESTAREGHESSESDENNPPTEYELVSLCGGRGDDPRFDTDVTIDTAEKEGRVVVHLDLTQQECEAIYDQLRGDGHEYPEDVRERVLSALQYDVQLAGRGD